MRNTLFDGGWVGLKRGCVKLITWWFYDPDLKGRFRELTAFRSQTKLFWWFGTCSSDWCILRPIKETCRSRAVGGNKNWWSFMGTNLTLLWLFAPFCQQPSKLWRILVSRSFNLLPNAAHRAIETSNKSTTTNQSPPPWSFSSAR